MDDLFRDRRYAGVELAAHLTRYANRDDVVVLALPRGGVPVAWEVAAALHAPLDVLVVRKLGTPGHSELAMGAIASGGVCVLNDDVVDAYRIPAEAIDAVAQTERIELERRERAYRHDRPPLDVRHRTVILVDDGLATGSTMKAAVRALRLQHPAAIVVAVPVSAPETCGEVRAIADDVVCLRTPPGFMAVGQWYRDFPQTTDEEVRMLMGSR